MTSRVDALLSECLRAYPALPALDPSALPDAFWSRAHARGVAVSVAAQLGIRAAPVAAWRIQQTAMALRSRALTVRCLRLCAEMGIAAAPLKGPLLAERLYGDLARRPTSDVDLLVVHRDARRLVSRLGREGAAMPAPHVHDYYEKHHHHLDVMWCGVLVEVHFRATSSFGVSTPAEPLLARSTPATADGQPMRVLESSDELVYLATHAAAHYFASDILLLDLKLLQQTGRPDWSIVERRSRARRLDRAVGAAFLAAERRVGFDTSGMSPPWHAQSRRVLHRLPPDLPAGYVDDWRVRLRQRLAEAMLCNTRSIAARVLGHAALRATKRRLQHRWPTLVPASWRA
ncbi:MAG: nucleotidyltransferase family protein [Deltaproteobacteria bacterium]|nr:nucleotidyltransferase family protein [Deltaproteobacteria bacterium]